jgi:hypothetical protein
MQERAYEKVETLWPYSGFSVRAFERRLGEGKLTLTEQSLLFEAKTGETIGFDLPTLRLIRLMDVYTLEVAYSIQGELRNASFRVMCTFLDGTERDMLPTEQDSYRMSLLRAISAGVVARFLADHSNGKLEGLTRMSDEKFEARIKDLDRNISIFPSKREIDEGVFWDESLRKESLQEAELETAVWEDPDRARLFYTGTNPRMNIDNALEKLDLLREDWINGRLNPEQRARAVACDYKIQIRHFEMAYTDAHGGSPEAWRASAERLLKFEKGIGIELQQFF